MATVVNARDVLLQAASPRVEDVTLPSNYDTAGDHTGTLTGSAQTNFQNAQITLSSMGALQNAGGGQVTNGASIGSLNASNITTGTLSASRIGASSIDATKLSVSTLSAITASLGTVTAGNISGSANIDITGSGMFKGAVSAGGSTYAVTANTSGGAVSGVYGIGSTGLRGVSTNSGSGVHGTLDGTSGTGTGVQGSASGSSQSGVTASHNGGGNALIVVGKSNFTGQISINTQTISNLTAGSANSVAGANVSGTVANATNSGNATNSTNASNSNSLGGTADSGWCRQLVTDSGTASASSYGFVLTSTVSGVRTRATGGRNVVIESFSDESLKFNIKPEMLGLDFISKLTPITYQIKDNPGITHHGLGARAVKKFINGNDDALCREHDDGVMGVDYMSMVGVLVKAVQGLNMKVQQLQNTINQMES